MGGHRPESQRLCHGRRESEICRERAQEHEPRRVRIPVLHPQGGPRGPAALRAGACLPDTVLHRSAYRLLRPQGRTGGCRHHIRPVLRPLLGSGPDGVETRQGRSHLPCLRRPDTFVCAGTHRGLPGLEGHAGYFLQYRPVQELLAQAQDARRRSFQEDAHSLHGYARVRCSSAQSVDCKGL